MCEAKTGDRKVRLRIPALLPLVLMDRVGAQLAYDAFVVAIRAFPWASSDFAQRTRTATAALFSAFPALTQDAAILDRAKVRAEQARSEAQAAFWKDVSARLRRAWGRLFAGRGAVFDRPVDPSWPRATR